MIAAVDPEHTRAAAQLLAGRRERDAIFGEDRAGFGEPAWDMLLALFVGDARSERMTWREVATAGAAPIPAAADRYLEWLISRDLVKRQGNDVAISARGQALMTAYFERSPC